MQPFLFALRFAVATGAVASGHWHVLLVVAGSPLMTSTAWETGQAPSWLYLAPLPIFCGFSNGSECVMLGQTQSCMDSPLQHEKLNDVLALGSACSRISINGQAL
jgi:hypothetical protein